VSGGKRPYQKGARAEYIVRDRLRAAGWLVLRAYGSKGPFDLLGIHAGDDPALVQVKSHSARMGPAARRALLDLALELDATPVLAHYQEGTVTWSRITAEGLDEWTP
jgi:hypothetical protein